MALIVISTTIPSKELAEKISLALIGEKLAACTHVLSPHTALYEWEGKIQQEEEFTLLIKTDEAKYPEVEIRLKELHPYECPYIAGFKADQLFGPYAEWMKSVLK